MYALCSVITLCFVPVVLWFYVYKYCVLVVFVLVVFAAVFKSLKLLLSYYIHDLG